MLDHPGALLGAYRGLKRACLSSEQPYFGENASGGRYSQPLFPFLQTALGKGEGAPRGSWKWMQGRKGYGDEDKTEILF